MPRLRRRIYSRGVYEICFRTRKGLPFTVTESMKLLIKSILARVQHDHKVRLCHCLWMGNHPHLIVVANDAYQCTAFYGQIQKQLTDTIKRLLNLRHLNLFRKNKTTVIRLHSLETAIERISYLYCNPAKAGIASSISNYLGLSTWKIFLEHQSSLKSKHKSKVAWIRMPTIPPLPCLALSKAQDKAFSSLLVAPTEKEHELVIEPNAWLEAFGVLSDAETQAANDQILESITNQEKTFAERRQQSGNRAMKPSQLYKQPLTLNYTPKKFSRAVHTIEADAKLRTELISDYKNFCAECELCYRQWKLGNFTVEWPPGAFRPAIPLTTNFLAEPEILFQ